MSEIEEADYFDEQSSAQLEITKKIDLTCIEAFEQRIPYGFTKGITTLKVVNRLLALRGLEIVSLNEDFGRELMFIIQEKTDESE
jgi:hypothetical protein